MKAIVISQKDFDREFEVLLQSLKLENFRNPDRLSNREPHTIDEMHRTFHYQVCMFKSRLEDLG